MVSKKFEEPGASSKMKYPSSIEVAQLAGVSQSAVSRTFTEGASVSEQTRAKVLKAATQLGYRPSAIPRIMFTHRSNLVAIAAGGLYNPMMAALLEAYTLRLQSEGFQVLLFNVEGAEPLDEYIPRIASYRVDALFITRCIMSRKSAEEFRKFRIPIISFNTEDQNDWVSSVRPDDFGGGRQIAELFIRRGAKRFAYIAGLPNNIASNDRLAGFQEGLKKGRKPQAKVECASFRYEAGFEAAMHMFEGRDRPDALFCGNDLIAMGAIDALRKLKIRVPEDTMVAGFDDIPQASWDAYNLTTLAQSIAETVDRSMQLFRGVLDGSRRRGARSVVPVSIVERGSTSVDKRVASPTLGAPARLRAR
jgi:DNA-binding LacI/PurR family transcriptional regulator